MTICSADRGLLKHSSFNLTEIKTVDDRESFTQQIQLSLKSPEECFKRKLILSFSQTLSISHPSYPWCDWWTFSKRKDIIGWHGEPHAAFKRALLPPPVLGLPVIILFLKLLYKHITSLLPVPLSYPASPWRLQSPKPWRGDRETWLPCQPLWSVRGTLTGR